MEKLMRVISNDGSTAIVEKIVGEHGKPATIHYNKDSEGWWFIRDGCKTRVVDVALIRLLDASAPEH
jgi:hypothetical protein